MSQARNQLCLPSTFTLVSCLAYFSTLKMEATCSSATSVDFQRTARRYIPEDRTLSNHFCENLNSYTQRLSQNGQQYARYVDLRLSEQ
jgi:hypothetical protein